MLSVRYEYLDERVAALPNVAFSKPTYKTTNEDEKTTDGGPMAEKLSYEKKNVWVFDLDGHYRVVEVHFMTTTTSGKHMYAFFYL